jgi:RNA polymerase sigma-70 factor (ECF subfamily)
MEALRLAPVDAPTDEDGIKQLARTDREAASEAVIRRWRDPLSRHAASIVKDAQEALDVAHEVLIRALREPRFFDPPFRMKAWLYRVTSNLCFNRVRDRRRRREILAAEPLPTATDADQASRVALTERQARIRSALDQLTENHRQILLLRYWSDLSYAEIGHTLGIELGTVMSRLSRARSRLLEHLGEEEREAS